MLIDGLLLSRSVPNKQRKQLIDKLRKLSSSCDLISVMLEFNRKLYCDGNGEPVEEKLEQIRKLMQ